VLSVLLSFEQKLQLQTSIVVDGKSHSLLSSKFQKLLSSNNNLTRILEGIDSNSHTKIHGDLTFENIMVRDDNSPFLIDPLSSFMDTRQLPRGFGITSPMFDLGKLLQSAMGGYETWSIDSHQHIERIANNEYNLKFVASSSVRLDTIFRTYRRFNQHAQLIGMFILSTIFVRIINYVNLDTIISKAILCYIHSLKILEEINNENFL
jgi:hypothetical protein